MKLLNEIGNFQMFTEKIANSKNVSYELRGKYTGIVYETSNGSIEHCNNLLNLYKDDDDAEDYPTEEDLLEYGDISYFENQH